MANFDKLQVLQIKKIQVRKLLESPVKLKLLTQPEVGLEREILDKSIYRPQLLLTGFTELFNEKRVQIFGNTEFYYLQKQSLENKIKVFEQLTNFNIPCIILTNNKEIEPELLEIVNRKRIAVFNTPFDTTKTHYLLSEYLDDLFAPQSVIHGSFVDVYGVGILFIGRSGIGKSEIALDLVERGHRLVADDVVMLTKKRENILMGTGTSLVKHFMEIRGLGIIDVRQMFGIRSIRFQKRLEIIVELLDWNPNEEYTRIGLDEEPVDIMGVEISAVKLPIFPGKNITVIAEVIAINYLLRTYGYNAAKTFADNLSEHIKKNKEPGSAFEDQRHISWFQADNE